MKENEKRLIDANRYKKILEKCLEGTYGLKDSKAASVMAGAFIACITLLDQLPTVEAVEADES